MSEAKRFVPNYTETGRYLGMLEQEDGEYILHKEYTTVKVERDRLAQQVIKQAFPSAIYLGIKCCICGCANGSTGGHPLAHHEWCLVPLAEKIMKEAGDGC